MKTIIFKSAILMGNLLLINFLVYRQEIFVHTNYKPEQVETEFMKIPILMTK